MQSGRIIVRFVFLLSLFFPAYLSAQIKKSFSQKEIQNARTASQLIGLSKDCHILSCKIIVKHATGIDDFTENTDLSDKLMALLKKLQAYDRIMISAVTAHCKEKPSKEYILIVQ